MIITYKYGELPKEEVSDNLNKLNFKYFRKVT